MDSRTLVDRVFQVLREQIVRGDYKPRQKLNLDQLARELNVSNTPVREAMARLERLGLVEIVPYSGPRVRSLDPSHVTSIYDVRIALEELAVKLIAERDDPSLLDDMSAAIEMHEQACKGDDPRAVIEADRAFHEALVMASGNSILLEMLPGLSDRTQLVLELNEPPSEAIDRPAAMRGLEGHRRVYEALRAGKPDVAALELRYELTRGKERLVEQMMKLEAVNQNE